VASLASFLALFKAAHPMLQDTEQTDCKSLEGLKGLWQYLQFFCFIGFCISITLRCFMREGSVRH
jgi:hypothetical protein